MATLKHMAYLNLYSILVARLSQSNKLEMDRYQHRYGIGANTGDN